MRHRIRHWLMLGLGWGFILLGIAGLFLPVLQGILFLAIGLVILSRRSPRVRLLVIRLGRRYPKFRTVLAEARGWMKRQRARFSRALARRG